MAAPPPAPAGPPPSHYSRGPQLLGWQWGSFALATVVFFPRIYLRLIVLKNFGWDDFFIVLSWILALWASIAINEAVKYGYGDHLQYAPNPRLVLLWSTPAEITTVPAVAFVKLSICCFILRVLRGADNRLHRMARILIWVNVTILVPVSLATMFVLIFQCIPLSAVWNEFFPADKCLNRHVVDDVVILVASVSAFTDVLTVCLPIIVLHYLQIDRKVKIGLSLLISLGVGICAVAIAKAVTGAVDFSDPDSTYALIPVAITAALEHQLGIFVACLPPCMPVGLSAYRGLRSVASTIKRTVTSRRHSTGASSPSYLMSRTSNVQDPESKEHSRNNTADPNERIIKVVCDVETFQERSKRDPEAGWGKKNASLDFDFSHAQSSTTSHSTSH